MNPRVTQSWRNGKSTIESPFYFGFPDDEMRDVKYALLIPGGGPTHWHEIPPFPKIDAGSTFEGLLRRAAFRAACEKAGIHLPASGRP